MEKFYNISDHKPKRIAISLILGLDSEGDFIKEQFNLMHDFQSLLNISQKQDFDSIGFIVEESCFEEGKYNPNGVGENEYQPLKYYLVGTELENELKVKNVAFTKCFPAVMLKNQEELRHHLCKVLCDCQKYDVETISDTYKDKDFFKKFQKDFRK